MGWGGSPSRACTPVSPSCPRAKAEQRHTKIQEGVFGVRGKGTKHRGTGRGTAGVTRSSENVSSVPLVSQLSSEAVDRGGGRKAGPQAPGEDRKGWAGHVREGTEACSDDNADLGGLQEKLSLGKGGPRAHVSVRVHQRPAPPWHLLRRLYSHSVCSSLWRLKSRDTLGSCPTSSQLVRASTWLPQTLTTARVPAPRMAPRQPEDSDKARSKRGGCLGVAKDMGLQKRRHDLREMTRSSAR